MKTLNIFELILALAAAALVSAGCATANHRGIESTLSAAGFHTITPSTSKQQACYAALPAYKLERTETNGKVIYAYADKKAGLLYVGDEDEYQQFRKLALKQKIANEQLQAAQMNENAATGWAYWGGAPGVWW